MAKFHIQYSTNAIAASFDEYWDHQAHFEKFGKALLASSRRLGAVPWALVDDIRNWPVKTPQEIDCCIDLAIKLSHDGLTHCAVCVDDNAVSKWMMKKILPTEVNLVFFADLAQCYAWLKIHRFDDNFAATDA